MRRLLVYLTSVEGSDSTISDEEVLAIMPAPQTLVEMDRDATFHLLGTM